MMTEKIRVSASSIIRSVPDTSATPTRSRRAGESQDTTSSVLFNRIDIDVAPGFRHRRGWMGIGAAAGGVDGQPAASRLAAVRVRLRRLRDWRLDLPPAAGAIVFFVGVAVPRLRAVHPDLRRGRI